MTPSNLPRGHSSDGSALPVPGKPLAPPHTNTPASGPVPRRYIRRISRRNQPPPTSNNNSNKSGHNLFPLANIKREREREDPNGVASSSVFKMPASSLAVLASVLLFSSRALCSSSGAFYTDNERGQTVLYEPLAERDKVELQQEVLHLLGLHHRPKPRHHDTHSSAPRYLLDLYKAIEVDPAAQGDAPALGGGNGTRALGDADFIVSFVNKIHHHSPHLRHEKDRRFWFDLSEVPPDEDLVRAELRIYRNLTQARHRRGGAYTLSVYAVAEGEEHDANTLDLIDETTVTDENGWLQLNVTIPVMDWIAFPKKNLGLYLKIKTSESRSADPHELGVVGSKGQEELQPFMVAFFKSASSQVRVRSRRAAPAKKRKESYYDHDVYGYTGGPDRYSSRRSCHRENLYVSFRELDWQDWIIAPDGYGAFYCYGECSFPLNANMNASNHAIVQTLVHLIDPSVVPKPCCAPTQLSAITVLYFDDNSNVILKKYKNMVVKSCGCH